MTFAIVDVSSPPPWTVADVQPVYLNNEPENRDIIYVNKSGRTVEFKVRWVACNRIAIFPEGYPKVDKLIAGVFI